MDYQFKDIEKKWQQFWAENETYKAENSSSKPKYYVLDMFPYPSGAGLHVGHPLGYIASDIFSRYKRLKGFNVLHPMGYDSFGLPAEQYAIQTGQHPAITTEANIKRYREQLDNLGFSLTGAARFAQVIRHIINGRNGFFMQLFNSWYNLETDRAENIETLIAKFEKDGNNSVQAVCDEDVPPFNASHWHNFNDIDIQEMLLKYRLAYLRQSAVNWCAALGTVLANDEVKDGISERGGYPVVQKKMMQWSMRITAYAERLLQGLETIDWPEPLKEMQRNWIGKSVGALVEFTVDGLMYNHEGDQELENLQPAVIEVFTTRVDTIFGVSFLVVAPEHVLVPVLMLKEQQEEVEAYLAYTRKKSELERMADTKTISGAFTGSYAINPLNGERIPIWIADYVLAGYGTGAVMGVPSGDQRDYLFAKHFNLPIIQILDAQQNLDQQADPTKEGRYMNSGLINGTTYKEAIPILNSLLENSGFGKPKVNYRMRDAIFGRQRYWGEPVPVYFNKTLPFLIKEDELPLVLPEVDKYLPTESGEPPLGRADDWKYQQQYEYELSTMPGWAGSSWYWYRYMDAQNDKEFASKEAIQYWKDVDLYIGGSEHATGHLLYSRFWNKLLKDLGYVEEEEPFKKLINQGMIQGRSNFVYRLLKTGKFISKNILDRLDKYANNFLQGEITEFENDDFNYHDLYVENVITSEDKEYLNYLGQLLVQDSYVDVSLVENDILDIEAYKKWRPEFQHAEFILENGKYVCGVEVEKMSKSKFNVVNPDDLIERYGADTLRMYEMFLGPLEQSKPWNTNGIEGVFKFLRKFWKLFHNDQLAFSVSDDEPSKAELKSLHKIIHKAEEDIGHFSFNTSVSSFMICVNELTELKCNKRKILQELVIVLSPYAPHITEELWSLLGNKPGTLSYTAYPQFNPEYLIESEFSYPISVNGKMRMNINLPMSLEAAEVEKVVLSNPDFAKYLEGKQPKKVIFVKGKIVNVVV